MQYKNILEIDDTVTNKEVTEEEIDEVVYLCFRVFYNTYKNKYSEKKLNLLYNINMFKLFVITNYTLITNTDVTVLCEVVLMQLSTDKKREKYSIQIMEELGFNKIEWKENWKNDGTRIH